MKMKFASRKKLTKKQKALIVILAVLFILICLVAGTLLHYTGLLNYIRGFNALDPNSEYFDADNINGLDIIDPNSIEWDLSGPLGDEELLNILLVGQDRRPGEYRERSDAMLICSINMETGKVAVISFMRDMYVRIPGYSDNKLNAAYVFGGFPLLKETLYENFGITTDGCFEVDFNGFENVINALGGVDVQLTREEAKYLKLNYSGEGNHLNGGQALTYSRIRSLDSDFGRTGRQRKVLMSVFEKARTKSVPELLALLDKILPLVTTDMNAARIYFLAARVAPLVVEMEVSTHHVPMEGAYKNAAVKGMSVLIPDIALIKENLKFNYLPF